MEIKGQQIFSAFTGMPIWSNGSNAILCLINRRQEGNFYLALLEPQVRNVVQVVKPLVHNQAAIDKATQAKSLGLPVEIPEAELENTEALFEVDSLDKYQEMANQWINKPASWWHNFYDSGEGRFYLITEIDDQEGEIISHLPLRVKLPGGQVAAFQPCVEVKTTYWPGTVNTWNSKQKEYIEDAIKRLPIPAQVVILCNGIATAMVSYEAEKKRQSDEASEAYRAKQDAEDRKKFALEFGASLPPEEPAG